MIKNLNNLTKSNLREDTLEIIESGFRAINTKKAIQENIKFESETLFIKNYSFSLKEFKRIFVISIGKCAAESSLSLEKVLGDKITGGIAVDICDPPNLKKIKFIKGTHPFPSENNKKAADKIINLLKKTKKDDFVIFIISGGGSTLLCSSPNISPFEEKDILEKFFKVGADIEEINTIRKHISLARGGNLAKYTYPAKGVSLIFSDVPSNNLQFIASGPTVKDETTIEDAKKVIKKYNLNIEKDKLLETPKDDKYFKNIKNLLFVSNKNALSKMKQKAEELGYNPEIVKENVKGEAKDVGKKITDKINESLPKTVLLYGGETTVIVRKEGKGGRNQELVLSAISEIKKGSLVASIASDGRDNTDHAGAIGDEITKKKAKELKIDPKEYLENNNSYVFFEKTGDYCL